MKKIIIVVCVLLIALFIGSTRIEINAADTTFHEGVKSPAYDSKNDPADSKHLGYYYELSETSNNRSITCSDIYLGNKFRIRYAGVLSSQQITMQRSILYIEQVSISKMSFFMTDEFYHTNELTFSVTAKVNDIESGIGVTWSKTTRYANGVKITTEVGNDYTAPFVVMALYAVDAKITEVTYHGTSTKSSGSWSSYTWKTPTNESAWATIGYVAYYAFIGADDLPNYQTGQYLIDNNSDFGNSELFFSGD